jgi:hypothetical protein
MAAPRFAPVPPTEPTRSYASPDHVPDQWLANRPGEIDGLQPRGARLGAQGPDQGFALRIARQLTPRVRLQPGERLDDAIQGALGIALRRASMFGRAPVVHDLVIAFTIWGYFDEQPPAELVEHRRRLFEGVANVAHHYAEARAITDMVPEATLRSLPEHVAARYPAEWRELTGA